MNYIEQIENKIIDLKIAVVCHLFYIDLAEELISYFKNIPIQYDLYITTTHENKECLQKLLASKLPNVKIFVLVYENRGRDIYPFIEILNKYLIKYDLVCKIHSKKSNHDINLKDWRQYLMYNLLGNPIIIKKNISEFIQNKKLGIIWPVAHAYLKYYGLEKGWGPKISCDKNFTLANLHFPELHLNVLDPDFTFPMGSMFWFRPEALVLLTEKNIDLNYFEMENKQVDGTFAHALERLFGIISERAGFETKTVFFSNKSRMTSLEFKLDTSKLANLLQFLIFKTKESKLIIQTSGYKLFLKLFFAFILKYFKKISYKNIEQIIIKNKIGLKRQNSKINIQNNYLSINNKRNAVFTICSKNYLHYALTLRESLLKYNNCTNFIIFICDNINNEFEADIFKQLNLKGVEFYFIAELNIVNNTNFEAMLFKYHILEANTAFKPFIIRYLFHKGYQKVIYLDPDIYVYSTIQKVFDILNSYDIIVTPHITIPYNDPKKPGLTDIMKAGIYNLGFIALSNTVNSINFLNWWAGKLENFCYVDLNEHLFVDQKWCDWLPVFFENIFILKNPGYNTAYWNLHERYIKKVNSVWFSNDDILVFFHFSGLNLDKLNDISLHQNRFSLENFPNLIELFNDYKKEVLKQNPEIFTKMLYNYNYLPNTDILINNSTRRRLFEKILDNQISNPFLSDYYQIIQITKLLKIPIKQNKDFINYDFGFNIISFLAGMVGTSEIARNFINSIFQTGIKFSLVNVPNAVINTLDVDEIKIYKNYISKKPLLNHSIYFFNADTISNIAEKSLLIRQNIYSSAVWWWEFDDYLNFPEAFQYIDEVIVYTDFIKTAVEKSKPDGFKVRKMTFPYNINWVINETRDNVRTKMKLNNNDFVYFFNFDFYSCMERKNPLAVLDTFAIVSSKYKDCKLILKLIHQEAFSDDCKLLYEKIAKFNMQNRVIVLTDSISRNAFMSIINACDAYISMHRSEGLGLGMLEAMTIGKPVIATRYGGNLEFMSDNNSLLIDYQITEVMSDWGPYRKGWLWANPYIEDAVEKMLYLYENREYCIQLGIEAKKSIEFQFFDRFKIKNELYGLLNHH
jgi:glycosyltransferase involved in cell wall biosynthesis